jgi:hypothetical protein
MNLFDEDMTQSSPDKTAQEAFSGNSSTLFFELAKLREEIVEKLKAVDAELEKVMETIGVGNLVQDPSDKVVYKVVEPSGRYVHYKKIDYVRTRRTLDEKADLSMTEAIEAGFDLGELGPKRKK